MTVKFNRTGTEILLEKLEHLPLSQETINDIMSDRLIDIWIKAYESWIDDARSDFEKILASFHLGPPDDLSNWGEHIDKGLRLALEDLDKMKANLAFMSEFNWAQAEWSALKFLPEGTPINVDVFATIDGFNGGMFRPGKVFISILYLMPSMLNPSTFSHEFHHSGFDHWWKQDVLTKEYLKTHDTKEYWTVRLHEYLVSEGLANAYCSPTVIQKVESKSDYAAKHNEIITDYDKRWDEFHMMLQDILDSILDADLDEMKEKFEAFTMDNSGMGHPIGHFFSGRMIQAMDRSQSVQREKIINLVKEPFLFFKLYDIAARERGLKRFSKGSLERLDALIEKMRASIS